MFMKKFGQSLRFKFIGMISGMLFVGTLVTSTTITLNETNMLHESLMTKGRGLASYIAKLGLDPLIMKNNIQLDSIVNEANKDEDVMYAIIGDALGNPITSQYASINYRTPRTRAIISGLAKDSELNDIVASFRKTGEISELSVPIISGSDVIGRVTMGLSEQRIRQQTARTLLFVVGLNLAVAVAMGAVLFVTSKRLILEPVTELAQATTRLAKGDLSTELKTTRSSELQLLFDSFNEMAANLEKTTVSREYVDNIIRSMINSVVVVSANGRIVRANAATCALLGYEENELVGEPLEKIFEKSSPSVWSALAELKTEESVSNSEAVYQARDGRSIPMIFSSSVLRNMKGDYQGIVCVAQDITELKKSKEALEEKARELARSNAELEQFAYVASHDLQEPLRMVASFVQLLDHRYKGKLDSEADEFIAYAVEGATRMKKLINDLLALSRVGGSEREMQGVHAEAVLEQALGMLKEKIEQSGAVITHGPLPTVVANAELFVRLFGNLLDNALKFRSEAPPRIHVAAEKLDGQCLFSVCDNGIGIAPRYFDKIFRLFQRLNSRDQYPGTGIGLTECKKIVEHHGGKIWVESVSQAGATFYFTMPLDRRRSGG